MPITQARVIELVQEGQQALDAHKKLSDEVAGIAQQLEEGKLDPLLAASLLTFAITSNPAPLGRKIIEEGLHFKYTKRRNERERQRLARRRQREANGGDDA